MPEYQDCVFCSRRNHPEGVDPYHETSECPRNPKNAPGGRGPAGVTSRVPTSPGREFAHVPPGVPEGGSDA